MKWKWVELLLSVLIFNTTNIIINMYTTAISSIRYHTKMNSAIQLPKLRPFIPIPSTTSTTSSTSTTKGNLQIHGNLRVLQFNILADGLYGLRDDLGAFSRAQKEDVSWSRRKIQLLHEITQYNPDIITLQECDHYYDTFLPELAAKGYDGLFAPKPASACLEVSDNFDGCAIFVKRNKLRVVSSETITFALSKADLARHSEGEVSNNAEDTKVKAQNQVGLIAVCRLLTGGPPIIVATTHLKAAKNAMGEIYRYVEIMQLLNGIEKAINNLSMSDKTSTPAILLTGDLNAAPSESTGYIPKAYSAVKSHPFDLRSVMNDDYEPLVIQKNGDKEKVWTTWKARRKHGIESVTKHCIDYILYNSPIEKSNNSNGRPGFRPISALDLFKSEDIGENLLPSSFYPSDHVAIAADLQLVSYEKPPGIDLLENIIR